jgi:hypothetical protein
VSETLPNLTIGVARKLLPVIVIVVGCQLYTWAGKTEVTIGASALVGDAETWEDVTPSSNRQRASARKPNESNHRVFIAVLLSAKQKTPVAHARARQAAGALAFWKSRFNWANGKPLLVMVIRSLLQSKTNMPYTQRLRQTYIPNYTPNQQAKQNRPLASQFALIGETDYNPLSQRQGTSVA